MTLICLRIKHISQKKCSFLIFLCVNTQIIILSFSLLCSALHWNMYEGQIFDHENEEKKIVFFNQFKKNTKQIYPMKGDLSL